MGAPESSANQNPITVWEFDSWPYDGHDGEVVLSPPILVLGHSLLVLSYMQDSPYNYLAFKSDWVPGVRQSVDGVNWDINVRPVMLQAERMMNFCLPVVGRYAQVRYRINRNTLPRVTIRLHALTTRSRREWALSR